MVGLTELMTAPATYERNECFAMHSISIDAARGTLATATSDSAGEQTRSQAGSRCTGRACGSFEIGRDLVGCEYQQEVCPFRTWKYKANNLAHVSRVTSTLFACSGTAQRAASLLLRFELGVGVRSDGDLARHGVRPGSGIECMIAMIALIDSFFILRAPRMHEAVKEHFVHLLQREFLFLK